MIKYNNSNINDWYFAEDNIVKLYRNGAVVYYKVITSGDTPEYQVCYAVVDNISQYQDREFVDVYNKADEKWYKLNNLNQYEEYGVYGTSTAETQSRLPQGYTEVEYVENTSSAYLDLDVYPYNSSSNSYTVEAKFSSTQGSNQFEYLFSCEQGNLSPYVGFVARWQTTTPIGLLFDGTNYTSKNITNNQDGTSGFTITSNLTNATNTTPITLFCGLQGSTVWRNGKGKVYSFKVTINDNLVRDMIPCKRDNDNMVGMYDIVNDVFYYPPNYSSYQLVASSEVTPTAATYYQGKLAIVDGYEYQYSGSSWVNVGEVSGSTATLPDVPFSVNYNANNYDANTKTLLKTSGQLVDTDAVITAGTPTVHDGYLTIASGTRATISGYSTYFNRTNSNGSRALTIVSKQKTESSNCHMFANRDSNYNWMYRCYSNKLTLHGSSETGSIAVTTQPVIESVRVQDSSPMIVYNNYTNSTTSSTSSFSYGSTNNGKFAMFQGYGTTTGENFVGDFYWVYMSQNTLTDSQIQQVIDYNENSGGTVEYPIYYDEKADPLNNLTFQTMEDAQDYAYNNCVYDGMRATIGGDRYYFDSEDENGWVKVLSYYTVEDVTPNADSGWTITGSSTYNPDRTYYDDFDLETTWGSTVKYKIAKVTIFGYENFTYYLRAYNGYSYSYSYVVSTNIDELQSDPTSMSYNDSRAITNTYGKYMSTISPVNLNNYRRVTYNNLDKTVEHTFYVVFYGRSNGTAYIGNATILIPKEQTNENWEQVTFSASSNVASAQKNLYIDGNNSTSGGTNYWYYRWIVGLPSGSHSSYTNYGSYDYCGNVTSSTFTSVSGETRQVNYTWDAQSSKTLQFRLVDESGNTINTGNTVYYALTATNACNLSLSNNYQFPTSLNVKVGGSFRFANSSNRHYIYGYSPSISLNTNYYVDNYTTYFDIPYIKLATEAVTITYTTYDPNDVETPAFKTDITYPYNGGTTSSTTLTSYEVPYTYSYTVAQTSNLFSASTYEYTASQATRTISFTLYPNNREFSTVADLEAYQYAWEGMNAYVGGTKYKYTNGEWVEYTDYTKEYLTFEPISSAVTFAYKKATVNYSLDSGTTWNSITTSQTVTVNVGQKIMWKATLGTSSDNGDIRFASSGGTWKAYGNLMSMQAGDNFSTATSINSNTLHWMFYKCSSLVNIDDLKIPVTSMGSNGLRATFRGCGFATVPSDLVISATSLGGSCYMGTFEECVNLTAGPILPATTIPNYGYYAMFNNCSSLTACTCLATSNIGGNRTQLMLNNVAATGIFYKHPNATWSSGQYGYPSTWTVQNYQG